VFAGARTVESVHSPFENCHSYVNRTLSCSAAKFAGNGSNGAAEAQDVEGGLVRFRYDLRRPADDGVDEATCRSPPEPSSTGLPVRWALRTASSG
jgi:hypothetical protein